MKRRIMALVLAGFCLLLCGCGVSMERVRQKAEKRGYTVTAFEQERLTEMEKQMGAYRTSQGLTAAFLAVGENGETAMTVEFQLRSDAEIVYKEIRKNLSSGETVDLQGRILVYGETKAVKDLL